MDLNLAVIAGRLAAPPEMRTFESGSRLLRLLITTVSFVPRRRIDVVPVTLWDPVDDLAESLPPPGGGLWMVGSIQRRFWQAEEGRRSRIEVVAHHVEPREDDPLCEDSSDS